MNDVDLARAIARFLTATTGRQMQDASPAQLAEELRRLADGLDEPQ